MTWTIAIIDRGIEAGHQRLRQCTITGVTIHHDKGDYRYEYAGYDTDLDGHGTAVGNIIHQALPVVPLTSVKLASPDLVITEEHLCRGIAWCLDQDNIRIINISLGIPSAEPSAELARLCQEASRRGIFISAAIHNLSYQDCYPAFFPTVYGVACGLVKSKGGYSYLGEGQVNVLAKGSTQRLAWKGNGFKISSGTSYATAHFSAILGGILCQSEERLTRDEMDQRLTAGSQQNVPRLNYIKNSPGLLTATTEQFALSPEKWGRLFDGRQRFSGAEKVALFPVCDKEMSTLLNFRGCSRFEFTCLIDYPNSLFGNSGHLAGDAIPDIRKRELHDEDYEKFDTIAIGYFLDKPYDANIQFGINLINRCLALNKNFVTWDDDVRELIKQQKEAFPAYTGRIWLVGVDQFLAEHIGGNPSGGKISIPIVAVIGTGNRQGKITTQMTVKRHLENEGYNVAHISTEPQGALLNADFVFPFGYKSTVRLPLERWGNFIHQCIKGIQEYRQPDLLITGIQGGLLPRGTQFLNADTTHCLASMHYLLAVKPDALICTIGPDDDPAMIRETVGVARTYVTCDPLFYALTPVYREFRQNQSGGVVVYNRKISPGKMRERAKFFEQELGMPVIDISDAANTRFIINAIQTKFS